jgi:hypothetical protein
MANHLTTIQKEIRKLPEGALRNEVTRAYKAVKACVSVWGPMPDDEVNIGVEDYVPTYMQTGVNSPEALAFFRKLGFLN